MFQIDARSRAVIDQRLRRSPLFRAGGGAGARAAGEEAAQAKTEHPPGNSSQNTDANAGARAGEPARTLMHEHAYLFSAMTLYCIYPPMPEGPPSKSSSVYPAKCSDESVSPPRVLCVRFGFVVVSSWSLCVCAVLRLCVQT